MPPRRIDLAAPTGDELLPWAWWLLAVALIVVVGLVVAALL